MKLLFVHERLGAFGGAETNVLATARELRDRGHTVALAFQSATGRGEPEWNETFAERFPLAGGADTEQARLAWTLGHFQPDAVFLHKMSTLGVLEALADCNLPVVRMVHDHDLYCMRGYKYNVFTRQICNRAASLFCVVPCGASVCRGSGGGLSLRWVSYLEKRRELAFNRRFRRLIVATSYMRDELLRNGFAGDRIEIHPPVPRASAAEGATFAGRNRIVYAGQVVRGKGVDILLESLAKVKMPFECIIIGDGSHRPVCERLRDALGLQDRVRFTGFLPQCQVAHYYRDASLSVMSSLWPEPFGATGLEAMRCGLPVVAFDAGGIREWLFDGVNGYLVPWMNREIFAARVDSLLCDKARARALGENGRRIVEEKFNFNSYINGLEKLFRREVTEPRSTPAVH